MSTSERFKCRLHIVLIQICVKKPVNHVQKILFSEIVFDDEYNKITKTPDRVSDDDDFKNGKICKISNVLNDILYIDATCNSIKTCTSKSNKESKLKLHKQTNLILSNKIHFFTCLVFNLREKKNYLCFYFEM